MIITPLKNQPTEEEEKQENTKIIRKKRQAIRIYSLKPVTYLNFKTRHECHHRLFALLMVYGQ